MWNSRLQRLIISELSWLHLLHRQLVKVTQVVGGVALDWMDQAESSGHLQLLNGGMGDGEQSGKLAGDQDVWARVAATLPYPFLRISHLLPFSTPGHFQ